jgi:hypothetical protein
VSTRPALGEKLGQSWEKRSRQELETGATLGEVRHWGRPRTALGAALGPAGAALGGSTGPALGAPLGQHWEQPRSSTRNGTRSSARS